MLCRQFCSKNEWNVYVSWKTSKTESLKIETRLQRCTSFMFSFQSISVTWQWQKCSEWFWVARIINLCFSGIISKNSTATIICLWFEKCNNFPRKAHHTKIWVSFCARKILNRFGKINKGHSNETKTELTHENDEVFLHESWSWFFLLFYLCSYFFVKIMEIDLLRRRHLGAF